MDIVAFRTRLLEFIKPEFLHGLQTLFDLSKKGIGFGCEHESGLIVFVFHEIKEHGRMAAVFDFGMDRGKIFKILPVDFRHIDYKESSFADPGRDDPIFIAPDHEAHVVFDGERVFAFGLDADGRLSDDALND